jgi:hypothetical protein
MPDRRCATANLQNLLVMLDRLQIAAVVPTVKSRLVVAPAHAAIAGELLRCTEAEIDLDRHPAMVVPQYRDHRINPKRMFDAPRATAERCLHIRPSELVLEGVAFRADRADQLRQFAASETVVSGKAVAGARHLRREAERADDLFRLAQP